MSSLEEIEDRQRRERKDLQSKIQSLKRVMKGDKSKKKEITQEIANLEFELENHHKLELDELQKQVHPNNLTNNDNTVEDETLQDNAPKQKSKAQKRREKKELEEKERTQRIKEQEKENLLGPRFTEEKTIVGKLKARELSIFSIPSDGDCLYKAVSHQLNVIRESNFAVEELRMKTADYIRGNKSDFLPFMSHPETYDMLTDIEFEKYCDDIASTTVWGGELEIRAMCNVLKCPIVVIQATGPETLELGSEFGGLPLVITYHRHMYKLGEHYNSTQPLIEETID